MLDTHGSVIGTLALGAAYRVNPRLSVGGDALAAGRAALEQAFAIDPFHLWDKNTLDLLDALDGFTTATAGRFTLVSAPADSALLTAILPPLLEEAFDTLVSRYQYTPPTPIRVELYDRHADFSVRTIGLTGLGALGVSFGPVLVLDAPGARPPGDFNIGSTSWHELAHTFDALVGFQPASLAQIPPDQRTYVFDRMAAAQTVSPASRWRSSASDALILLS